MNSQTHIKWSGGLLLLILVSLTPGQTTLFAQSSGIDILHSPEADYDTTYIRTYTDKLTTRFYLSQKYTNLELVEPDSSFILNYEPNTTLNLGIGVTVNSFTLNLAYGFKFLNPDEGQGKTRYLDLQSHIYTRKFIVDFFGQFYKGLYLANTDEINPDYEDPYYVRPDIYEQIFGLTAQYVANNRKFTYRAPFVHNERQLKSAGTFIYGVEAYYGLVQGDSALVPSFSVSSSVEELDNVTRISFFKAGPSGGYAYSLVVAQKFFATASLSLNLSYGYNHAFVPEIGTFKDNQFNMGAFFRFALGYNDDNWYLALSTVNDQVTTTSSDRSVAANFGIGNVRLNYVKRFRVGPKIKKYMDYFP